MSERSDEYRTDGIVFTNQPGEQEADCFIDVNVYHIQREQAEPPTVESDGATSIESVSDEPEETADEPEETTLLLRHHRRVVAILGGLLGLLVAVTLIITVVVPLLTPAATVTIIPVQASINTTATVQVMGRSLPSVTLTQAKTVPATGTGHQDAKAAHGSVTFYNGYTQAQDIPGGILLQTVSGIQIVTDASAYVPAAIPPTQGQATVAAHAIQTGPAGNIAAGSIYEPCCQAYILVQNTAPFTGGQDAKDFQMAMQRDLDGATTSLKVVLVQSANAAFQAQLGQGEALTPPHCTITPASDHKAGEEGTQVSVTVTVTCSAQAYPAQAVQAQAAQRLVATVRQQLGEGYALTGDPRITVLNISGSGNQTSLSIKAEGTAAYQFSQRQLQAIRQAIAGMGKDEATAWLARQKGVKAVSISVNGLHTNLPQNANAIHCTLLYMA